MLELHLHQARDSSTCTVWHASSLRSQLTHFLQRTYSSWVLMIMHLMRCMRTNGTFMLPLPMSRHRRMHLLSACCGSCAHSSRLIQNWLGGRMMSARTEAPENTTCFLCGELSTRSLSFCSPSCLPCGTEIPVNHNAQSLPVPHGPTCGPAYDRRLSGSPAHRVA